MRRVKRWPSFALVAAVLAMSAGACSGGSQPALQEVQHEANVRAVALLLTPADLPLGWQGASAIPDPAVEACLVDSGGAPVGHAYTGRLSISGAPASVGELVSIFAEPEAARAAGAPAYLDAALDCIEAALRDGDDPATIVARSRLDAAPSLDDRDIDARRLTFTVADSTVENITLDGYIDLIVTVEGSARITFIWATLYVPPDASDQDAFIEAARVAARRVGR